MTLKSNSRRSFLKNSALISAASAFPTILTKASTGLKAGEKVNLACIGIGNQGANDLMKFHESGLANFVALSTILNF